MGFPGAPVAKTPSSQCRGPGFHFWLGKARSHMPPTKTQHNQINKHIYTHTHTHIHTHIYLKEHIKSSSKKINTSKAQVMRK